MGRTGRRGGKAQLPILGARKFPNPELPECPRSPRSSAEAPASRDARALVTSAVPAADRLRAAWGSRGRNGPERTGRAAASLTQAADVEARGWPQRPAGPALSQRFQMLLLSLDQQDLLVDPAQEEGLGHRRLDLLVPEVLHVLGLEISEDLVADVMSGELPGLDRGLGLRCPGPLSSRPLGRAQDDG